LSAHLSAAHRQIESLVFENNSRRLVRALFALGRDAARIGISSIRMTHEELAGLIGASRESVTNLMVELRRQGLIEYKRGEVHPCLPKLARFLAQDD
jgi:CRP-like cAMP-binding protein